MIVTPQRGRLGGVVAFHEGVMLLFDRKAVQPPPDLSVDVMVSANLGYRPSRLDEKVLVIPALIVRPVTTDDFLLDHDGFECVGSMCRTTASVDSASDIALRRVAGRTLGWLTPGRTPVVEVSNINAAFDRREPTPKIPGKAYVSLKDVGEGRQRICGVPDFSHVDPRVMATLVRKTSGRGS